VFNLFPLPPLDGGRILVGILPASVAAPIARLEPYGVMILLGLLIVLPMLGAQLGLDLSPISHGSQSRRARSSVSCSTLPVTADPADGQHTKGKAPRH